MVNYRRVVCEVALLAAFVALTAAAPTPDCVHKHYDQRQNGTENYRLNIDGVVVAVAPAESMFSALGDMDDLMELLSLEDFDEDDLKPKPPSQGSTSSPLLQIVPVSMGGEKPDEKPLVMPAEKPLENKPAQDKPAEDKPAMEKPQEEKPEVPAKPEAPLSDVSMGDDLKIQRKEVSVKKQEKAKR